MQITAARLSIDPAKFEEFSRFVSRNGQVFLDSADDRLNSFSEVGDGTGASYGVGVFVFSEDVPATQTDRAPVRSSNIP
jgi:hypothetical protein